MGGILLSVCMITYNHERYVRHAIESVLMQETDFEIEIIVGDDCSTDHTIDIIHKIQKEYVGKIQLVEREQNIGMTLNSYDVRSRARGKYIAFLEGDDFWIKNDYLQSAVDFLETHKEAFSIARRMAVVNEREHPLGKIIPSIYPLNRYVTENDVKRWKVDLLHPGALVYRNFIKDHVEEFSFLAHGRRNFGGHMMMIYLLADMGKLYLSSDVTGAYRKVKRLTASNANSLVAQNELFWKKGRLEMFIYMREKMGKRYDFSEEISDEFVALNLYLKEKDIVDRIDVMKKYYKQLKPKEKKYVLSKLLSSYYF